MVASKRYTLEIIRVVNEVPQHTHKSSAKFTCTESDAILTKISPNGEKCHQKRTKNCVHASFRSDIKALLHHIPFFNHSTSAENKKCSVSENLDYGRFLHTLTLKAPATSQYGYRRAW